MCVSNVCGDDISFRRWEKHGAQSQPAPFFPNHSVPRHPTGLIPEEPTEAHKPRRNFNRAVHRTIYKSQAGPSHNACRLHRQLTKGAREPARKWRRKISAVGPHRGNHNPKEWVHTCHKRHTPQKANTPHAPQKKARHRRHHTRHRRRTPQKALYHSRCRRRSLNTHRRRSLAEKPACSNLAKE